MQELHNTVVENLLWLHDLVPHQVRERVKLWYDGANRIANDWVEKYNISEAQAAGVLASLSPQNGPVQERQPGRARHHDLEGAPGRGLVAGHDRQGQQLGDRAHNRLRGAHHLHQLAGSAWPENFRRGGAGNLRRRGAVLHARL